LSDLVKINDEVTNNFLYDLRDDIEETWIGLYSPTAIYWDWIVDDSRLGSYDNWGGGEPSDSGFCVEMQEFMGSIWEVSDCDDLKRFFCFYEMYSCNNVSVNNQSVCSGNGMCVFEDNCTCTDCYYGTNCEYHYCDGIKWDSHEVCNQNLGECVQCDVCTCQDEYYGQYCYEFIPSVNATLNRSVDLIFVQYEIPVSLLGLFESEFVASDIILNANKLDLYGKSYFIHDSSTTSYLVIETEKEFLSEFENDGLTGVFIELRSITGINETIGLQIEIVNTLSSPFIFEDETMLIIIIASISVVAAVLTMICCVITCITLLVYIRKNKSSNGDKIELIAKLESERNIAELKINEELFKINYKDIKILKRIGKGGGGQVFLGKWNGETVAYKCFQIDDLGGSRGLFDTFEKEVQFITSVRHPNIVVYYGCSLNPPRVGIVMEFCKNGDLKDYLTGKTLKVFDLEKRLDVIKGIVSAMVYLHSRGVIHRDLKAENVLLDKNLVPKLTDFGVSKFSKDSEETKTVRVGTSQYMAPEICRGDGKYSNKCDVFSFGILMFEILTSNFNPFNKKLSFNLELKIANEPNFRPNTNELNFLNDTENECLIDVVTSSWNHYPRKRPSFMEIRELICDDEDNVNL
jgi:predicted Ser/Thr protein kinase